MWIALVGLPIIAALIAVNAFFVAAEFAIVTVRPTWVREIAALGSPAACGLQELVTNLDDAIATTQLGITIVGVALGAIGEPALAALFELPMHHFHVGFASALAHTTAVIVAFALVAFVDAVLGELVPKAAALARPEHVALAVARPLCAFQSAAWPLVWLMNTSGNGIVRRLGLRPLSGRERVHSVGELKMLVEQTEDAGNLDPTQADVVEAALSLTDKRVRDVMVPAERVQMLSTAMSETELLDEIRRTKRTRMPVADASGDWLGVAVTKLALMQYLDTGHFDLYAAIYRPVVFHHAAPLPRVLRAFRKHRQHMAFVAGDDGERLGIVTLEDVLEELVGEIEDELDAAHGTTHALLAHAHTHAAPPADATAPR